MKYNCIRCGQEFEAKHKTAVCEKCHTAVCVVCGKEFELQSPWTQLTCSAKCRGIYRKQSGIAKHVAEKSKETFLQRYNVPNPSALQRFIKVCKYCGKEFETSSARQVYCDDVHYGECPVCGNTVEIKDMSLGPQACSEECRIARIKETCLARYGNEVSLNSDHGRTLAKETCTAKYGVDHYSKTKEYRNKYVNTMQKRYGVDYPLQSPGILEKLTSTCLDRYGVMFNCMTDQCRSSYRTVSKINQAFVEKLRSIGIDCSTEFTLGRKSYDIKVDNYLIEIDPTITHNSAMSIFDSEEPLSPGYHSAKSALAKESGYRCIHMFDWDNIEKVINLFSSREKVYARKCVLKEIDTSTCSKFLNKYHLQGSVRGQKVCLGLYYNHELMEVMTFGPARYSKQYEWELLRLCTAAGVAVVGGANKLFAYFVSKFNPKSIISYCDISKFTGDVYEKIGMTLHHISQPAKVWSKEDKMITDNFLRQRGYDQIFGTSYGKGTSNEELMLENGWLPVYDCGQKVFVYDIKEE